MVDLKGRLGECGKQGRERKEWGHGQKTGRKVSCSRDVCLQRGRPRFNPWVWKISWRRKWQPTPVLFPGKSHGRRNLVGYSAWSRKESVMTEQLHFLSFFLENCWFHYFFSSLLFLAVTINKFKLMEREEQHRTCGQNL